MSKKKNVQDALKRILNTFLSKIIYFGLTVKPLKPSILVGPKSDGLTEVDCIRIRNQLCELLGPIYLSKFSASSWRESAQKVTKNERKIYDGE